MQSQIITGLYFKKIEAERDYVHLPMITHLQVLEGFHLRSPEFQLFPLLTIFATFPYL